MHPGSRSAALSENHAISSLFRFWRPKHVEIDGPHGFAMAQDVGLWLERNGYQANVTGAPCLLIRASNPTLAKTAFDAVPSYAETAMLLPNIAVRYRTFLDIFRRHRPHRIIFMRGQFKWWAVWCRGQERETLFELVL